MKVCILSHCFWPQQGAADLYIWNLARELSKRGLEIVVITNAFNDEAPLFEEHENVRIYRFSNRFPHIFNNYGFMLGLGPTLKKVYEKEKFDLLHSEHVFPMIKGGKFAKKNNIPHVAVIEGISKVSLYSKLIHMTHRLVIPNSHFDMLVAWSKFLKDEFLVKWGISGDKIKIIPGALDLNKFNPKKDGTKLRENLLGSEKEKLILTVTPMNYTNVIGLAYTIKAMPEVIMEYKKCKLIVAGDGRGRKDMEKLASELGLKDHIEFIGWIKQEDITKYYAAADVIVTSTVYRHAGSVKVLESLSSGRPNALCNIESLPGENSFPTEDIAVLVKPEDESDMARGILNLLNDEELGERLGNNAWNFIKDNFSIEGIAKDYEKLYGELV
jgi:glycosyltransferase involved in cell wall biosynthesis